MELGMMDRNMEKLTAHGTTRQQAEETHKGMTHRRRAQMEIITHKETKGKQN